MTKRERSQTLGRKENVHVKLRPDELAVLDVEMKKNLLDSRSAMARTLIIEALRARGVAI
ncbi:hypothetical protein SAMN05660772_02079 [Pasteurella testudinis DSM 23072]|uniref:Ribbon-helix-helix protein, copG family n=1 Tax=Pasteurella testudinis DSM 23072 TaxID=1122938 RepID=A0A1W1UMR2_9PAST|nr:hypothetical protein [Pasteurella testudinis]SMB82360.1 hypothetical protein SAMN05660772_02079 [Pasteurella testudinis DSM 23072]SUB52235.1 Uncharacterised protein [Pasteurella testudinis]